MRHKPRVPILHLTKTLTTELCFTTQRLLCDKTVWSDRTGMHLIINHVVKFDHIDNTNRCFLVETISRFTIIQVRMTKHWDTGLLAIGTDLVGGCSVEDWRCKFHPELFSRPTKNCFIDLSKIHTAWYTQWVQYDINRCSIFKEWHVFSTNDLCNNAFVTVTTSHLIAHFQLTFYSEINLCKLQYTCWQFITDRDVKLLSLVTTKLFIEFDIIVVKKRIDLLVCFLFTGPAKWIYVCIIDSSQILLVEFCTLADLH